MLLTLFVTRKHESSSLFTGNAMYLQVISAFCSSKMHLANKIMSIFWHLLTAAQFEILQGVMEQEGAATAS